MAENVMSTYHYAPIVALGGFLAIGLVYGAVTAGDKTAEGKSE
jgi:hypothetical protein